MTPSARTPAGTDLPVLHYMQTWLPLSEQFVYRLVTGLRRRGIVVARRPVENRAAFPHRPVVALGRLFAGRRPVSAAERRVLTIVLLAVSARWRIGLVHSHHGYRLRDVEGLVVRRGVPWVASLHGHDVTTFVHQWPADMAPVLGRLDAAVVPSRWLAERVVDLGVEAERVHVIPTGVDTAAFASTPLPDGAPEVLFVGRFVEKKGVDVLLDAWPRIRDAVPGATLRLLGFGPLAGLLQSAGPGVVHEATDPARRHAQLVEALRRARVVVTPSRTATDGDSESLLLVNLEAQAAGRPVVTTRHAAVPEFVDEGASALVVPEGDAAALADAVVEVLRDPPLAARLAAAGPGVAARFDQAACTRRVDDLHDRLLSVPGGGGDAEDLGGR